MKKRALCPLSGVHLTIKPKCVSAKRAVSRRTSNECVHINRSYYAYYKLNAC